MLLLNDSIGEPRRFQVNCVGRVLNIKTRYTMSSEMEGEGRYIESSSHNPKTGDLNPLVHSGHFRVDGSFLLHDITQYPKHR
jgi:hypothetical protein